MRHAIFFVAALAFGQQDQKLDEAIRQFAAYSFEENDTKELLRTDSKVSLDPGGKTNVTVEIKAVDAAAVDALKESIGRLGGMVTAAFESSLFAELPPGAVIAVSELPQVYSITEQPEFRPIEDEAEGTAAKGLDIVRAIGVSGLHRVGIRGKSVRVGILDFGFQHYEEMAATGRLPKAVASQTFNNSGRLDGDRSGTGHGTACAEIIHDLAPDAELVLAVVDGRGDSILKAAEWLVSKGVRIISFSAGTSVGPYDGRAWLDRYIDNATKQHGVLWINSSGNQAASHWTGDASARDAAGWIWFSDQTGDKLFIAADGADRKDISVDVVWDDWGPDPQHPSGTQAIDASLYRINTETHQPEFLTASHFSPGRLDPVIRLRHSGEPGATYVLRLRARKVSGRLRVHVFVDGGRVAPAVAEGSLTIPATSFSALAVGAVSIRTGTIERYSARGPTDDGRPKPDLSAFDYTQSIVYADGFSGTSAACPAAAGFAALLAQARPELSGTGLREALLQFVRAPAGNSRNPAYGRGILDASLLLASLPK